MILEPRTEPGEPTDIFDFMAKLCFSICDLNGTSYFDDDPMAQHCVNPDDDAGLWYRAVHEPNALPVNPFLMMFDADGDRVITTIGENTDLSVYNVGCP